MTYWSGVVTVTEIDSTRPETGDKPLPEPGNEAKNGVTPRRALNAWRTALSSSTLSRPAAGLPSRLLAYRVAWHRHRILL